MDTSMINKIQRAGEYASQPERVTFHRLALNFSGTNNHYEITLDDEGWDCSCPGFKKFAICPHIMTLETLLKPMLKRPPLPYAPGQNIVSDVEKAKRYAAESDRIELLSFECSFAGYNREHFITYDEGIWTSTSEYFARRGLCSYTMALEKILKGMVQPVRAQQQPVA